MHAAFTNVKNIRHHEAKHSIPTKWKDCDGPVLLNLTDFYPTTRSVPTTHTYDTRIRANIPTTLRRRVLRKNERA